MTGVRYRTKGQYSAEFPLSRTQDADIYHTHAEIHQKIRQHDTAVLSMRSTRMRWFESFYDGAPVKITYVGQDGDVGTFLGYVTKIRPRMNADTGGLYERDIICVAASRELRKTDRHTYRNMTAPEIVAKIATKVGFRVVSKQHGLRRPTVVHGGETYWEFLTKLAKRTGYVLRVEGTTIYFMPLPDMTKAFLSRAPYLSDVGIPASGGYENPSVHDIHSWVGASSDDEDDLSDAATFTAVDPVTGRVHEVTERPGSAVAKGRSSRSDFIRYPSGVAAHSRADAKLLAKGAADNGMMAFDTKMTVTGSASLAPYHPVLVDVRDHPVNGTMIVKEVTHVLDNGTYYCDVVASTDSMDGVPRRPIPKRRVRDVGSELAQGFAPDTSKMSRLKVIRAFLGGAPGAMQGKWVAR